MNKKCKNVYYIYGFRSQAISCLQNSSLVKRMLFVRVFS